MDERDAYIALNMMSRVGPVGARALVSGLGSASAIFGANCGELSAVKGVGRELAKAIEGQRHVVDWEGEIGRAAEMGAEIVTFLDDAYPAALKKIHDPPLALYVWGHLQARDAHSVAVIGTRRPTHYGRETAGKLAFQFASAGLVVVSGLAAGVDTAAHAGALKARGRTLAVMGSGLDVIYPRQNAALARDIAAHGAVISEFPFGRQPDKTTFPIRNRIVSGLSQAIVVVEASARSGALITVNQALDQGRLVGAVPGRIDSPGSEGCHRLIKDGAQLVTDAEDVLAELGALFPREQRNPARPEAHRPSVTEEEGRVLALLEDGAQGVDVLIRESGLRAGDVSALLIGLEMRRMVKMLPGRVVELRRV